MPTATRPRDPPRAAPVLAAGRRPRDGRRRSARDSRRGPGRPPATGLRRPGPAGGLAGGGPAGPAGGRPPTRRDRSRGSPPGLARRGIPAARPATRGRPAPRRPPPGRAPAGPGPARPTGPSSPPRSGRRPGRRSPGHGRTSSPPGGAGTRPRPGAARGDRGLVYQGLQRPKILLDRSIRLEQGRLRGECRYVELHMTPSRKRSGGLDRGRPRPSDCTGSLEPGCRIIVAFGSSAARLDPFGPIGMPSALPQRYVRIH